MLVREIWRLSQPSAFAKAMADLQMVLLILISLMLAGMTSAFAKATAGLRNAETQIQPSLSLWRSRLGDNAVIPFESEGEPGLWPGYDPARVEPVPGPPTDIEPQGALATPLILPTERLISPEKPTGAKVQPGPPAPSPAQRQGALTGKFIYVGPGHGWTLSSGTYTTQRGNNNQMVEDHANADQVCFFTLEYFKNAGATVIPLRDVGPQTDQYIIDNMDTNFTVSGTWNTSVNTPFWGNSTDSVHYVYASTSLTETAVARWTPDIATAGYYPVFIWFRDATDRSTDAFYRIVHKGGVSTVTIDQNKVGKGWVWLGNFYFDAGTNGYLELSNISANTGTIVIADAARFGSGVHSASGYPMYEMNALEYNVFSKAPNSVTGVSDVWTRPRMAAYMNNANVKDVCYISFHTNAYNGAARGAISLKNSDTNAGGPAVYAVEFCTPIINHVQQELNNLWSLPLRSDKIYTSAYGELSHDNLGDEMTGTIVEVAFHDNAADATLLKTAGFRQDSARAVLKGIIDYFADTQGNPNNTYLPDAPSKVTAVASGSDQATISWSASASGGYNGGAPTGYYVYKSTDGLSWDNGIDVENVTTYNYGGLGAEPEYNFHVAAYNAGGESFPSETVGVRLSQTSLTGQTPKVLIVAAFRRYDNTITPLNSDPVNGASRRVWPWLINSFNYVSVYGNAVATAGYAFDSASCERVADGSINLTNYGIVLWCLGQESTADETFSATEQNLVTAYLLNGGNLFVSGSELGYDLELSGSATGADKNFLNNVLQVHAVNNNASTTKIANCNADGIFKGFIPKDFSKDYSGGYYDTLTPDAFTGVGTVAVSGMTYADTGLGAATQYQDGTKRVVVMGFPFEMIHGVEARAGVMTRILQFLGGLPTKQQLVDYLLGRGGVAYDVNYDGRIDAADVIALISLTN